MLKISERGGEMPKEKCRTHKCKRGKMQKDKYRKEKMRKQEENRFQHMYVQFGAGLRTGKAS